MKRNIRALFIPACLLLCSAAAHAADVQVIASKDVEVNEISADELKRIFLGTKSSLGDTKVKPVLQQGGATHEAFTKDYLGKSASDLDEYYKGLVFSGKGSAPKALANDAAVVSFVALSKGVIAYVSAAAIPMGVKKLTVKN